MASKKDNTNNLDNVDILSLLKGLTPEQRREVAQQTESLVEDDEIEQSNHEKVLNKITDFNDPRILPYTSNMGMKVHDSVLGRNCVYTVYNKKTGASIILTGDKLTRLFDDDNESNIFKAKRTGSSFGVRHYKVRFSHLNFSE